MTDYNRELRVAELNRILPMVKETMALEKRNFDLMKKQYKFNTIQKALEEKISFLQRTLAVSSNDLADIVISDLQECLSKYQTGLECLNSFIAVLEEQNSLEEARLNFDNNLYFAICSSIATDEGFLNCLEIQEEFIPYYIYLLKLTQLSRHCITIKMLFQGEQGVTTFLDLLHSKYSQAEVEKILTDIE